MKGKRSNARRFVRSKAVKIAPYHQEMLDDLMLAHGITNESELMRKLIEWEWEFIHFWDELPPEEETNDTKKAV